MARAQSTIDPWFISARIGAPEARALGLVPFAAAVSSPIAVEGGVLPTAGLTGMGIASNGTTGAPRIGASAGLCIIPDTTQYGWQCVWPLDTNILLTVANPTNPRRDLVVARCYGGTELGEADTGFYVEVIDGTAAPVPVAPSVPARAIPLAEALVATTGVVTITDRRYFTRTRGAPRISYNDGGRNGSHFGDLRIDYVTGAIDAFIASSTWVRVAQADAGWTSWTPALVATGGAVSVGTGGSAATVGRYRLQGKTLWIHALFQAGTTGVQGSTGNITMELPAGFTAAAFGEQQLHAKLYNNDVVGSFTGSCHLASGGTTVRPKFRQDRANDVERDFRSSTSGAAGQSIPLVSGGYAWSPNANLAVWGFVEIA